MTHNNSSSTSLINRKKISIIKKNGKIDNPSPSYIESIDAYTSHCSTKEDKKTIAILNDSFIKRLAF